MLLRDTFDLVMTAEDATAVAHYNRALNKLLTLNKDPLEAVNAALARDPNLVMGQVLRGLLYALSTERAQLPDARAALAAGQALAAGATPREQAHLAALTAWSEGRLQAACAHWEDILVAHPNDALAMFAAHQGDFFLGQTSELRDRVARRLPQTEPDSALAGYYLGMLAFGYEEMGDYARAEDAGRRSVLSDRRNTWALHAVAHVMEMTHRLDEGVEWLVSRAPDWSKDSFFAVHNWWHLALFYLEGEQWSAALALYDEHIRGTDSSVILELIDASALLWRLRLQGVDVGDRWQQLAAIWLQRGEAGWYAFNDVHAMLAYAGAGLAGPATQLLVHLETTALGVGDNATMTREVGLPLARALWACAQDRHAEAVTLLLPVKAISVRAGGSHAQRDLVSQTLLRAAENAGQRALARALLNERLALKPQSRLSRAWLERVDA
ncbi:MAG: tetratricopeptide repeat protein [Gammaproteobacteria bacterium]|nr:tetratricopeptide repeat protein [Gammaproteobacteria bacterium]